MVTVVLTQPQPRVAALARELARAGHEPLLCSFTRLEADPVELERLAATRWKDYERVLLVSPTTVQFLLDALGGQLPAEVRLGVVGPGSLETLRGGIPAGQAVDIVHPAAPPYDADALLALPALAAISGQRLLVLRGRRGRDDWIATLAGRGAQVDERVLYETRRIEPEAGSRAALSDRMRRGGNAVFVVTTSDAARQLDRWLDAAGMGAWARAQRALAVHPRIAGTMTELGWSRVACIEPGEAALRAALESC